MKRITTIFGYAMAVILLLITAGVIYLQSLTKKRRVFDKVIKFLCRLVPALFFIRVKSVGDPPPADGKARIYMSNHVNIFDILMLNGHIPVFLRGVELDTHFNWPLWGFITRRIGNIPISHSNVAKAMESLRRAQEALAKGISIAILPEGHRTRTGKLGEFKRGAFRFAKNSGADIVPVAMKGLWERKSVHSKWVSPGPVDFIFGEPIAAETAAAMDEKALRDYVREALAQLLDEE